MEKRTATAPSVPALATEADYLLTIIKKDYESSTLPTLGSVRSASRTDPDGDSHDSARRWLAHVMHSIKNARVRIAHKAFPVWASLEDKQKNTVKMCVKIQKELTRLSLWIPD
jgi:hypothetical protein